TGYLIIDSRPDDPIKNLNTLTKLNRVNNLSIYGTDIVNLTGLQNLEVVEEHFEIEFNDLLTSTNGLNKNISIGDQLIINSNPNLTNIDAFSNLNQTIRGLYIKSCNSLKDVDVFKKITRIEEELIIEGNPLLTNLNGFSNITYVGSALSIGSNISLISLSALNKIS